MSPIRRGLFGLVKTLSGFGRNLGLHRIGPINRLHSRFKGKLKTTVAEIEGFRLLLDSQDSLDLSVSDDYEEFERSLVPSLLRPGMTVVDIGANIGLYTLLFARGVGPEGRVHAFEPFRETFDLLQRNISHNGVSERVLAIQKAVAAETGIRKLYLSEENAGDHRLHRGISERQAIEIETVTLDDYFSETESRQIDLIKMDIQGSEAEALKGMRSTLADNAQLVLLMEFWPWGLREASSSGEEVLQILVDEMGFQLAEIDDRQNRLTLLPEPFELLDRFPADRIEHTNLLGWKGEAPLESLSRCP